MRYKILIIFALLSLVGCTGSPRTDERPEWLMQADEDYKLAQDYDRQWQVRLAEIAEATVWPLRVAAAGGELQHAMFVKIYFVTVS